MPTNTRVVIMMRQQDVALKQPVIHTQCKVLDEDQSLQGATEEALRFIPGRKFDGGDAKEL